MRPLLPLAALAVLTLAAAPAVAQRWGAPYGGFNGWDRSSPDFSPSRAREGKVEVTRFVADGAAAQALGHGPIAVAPAGESLADERERATYEAALIDRLAGVGYDTATKAAVSQTVEFTIRHAEVAPAQARRNPVRGSMAVGVDSRGGSYESLAVGVDLRKPLKALLSTRLEARIRGADGAVLWEGRADIATREGDPKWSDQAIAGKLASALFSGFPGRNGETIADR
jgi:hypothetical protein